MPWTWNKALGTMVAPTALLAKALSLMKLSDFFAQSPDLPTALKLIASRRQECNVVVDLSRTGPLQLIVWQGEITAANSSEVGEHTEARLANASGKVTIDLSAVSFIDGRRASKSASVVRCPSR